MTPLSILLCFTSPSFAQCLVQVGPDGIQEVCGVHKVLIQLHSRKKTEEIQSGSH